MSTVDEIEIPYLKSDDIEKAASALLESNQSIQLPVNPVVIAEKLGIEVYEAELNGDVSGVLQNEEGIYKIYVNQSHTPTRQRFTIAHELGHFTLHKDRNQKFVDPEINLFRNDQSQSGELRIEIQANMFAAALLMPRDLVVQMSSQDRSLGEFADEFGVSRDALAHRMINLGISQ